MRWLAAGSCSRCLRLRRIRLKGGKGRDRVDAALGSPLPPHQTPLREHASGSERSKVPARCTGCVADCSFGPEAWGPMSPETLSGLSALSPVRSSRPRGTARAAAADPHHPQRRADRGGRTIAPHRSPTQTKLIRDCIRPHRKGCSEPPLLIGSPRYRDAGRGGEIRGDSPAPGDALPMGLTGGGSSTRTCGPPDGGRLLSAPSCPAGCERNGIVRSRCYEEILTAEAAAGSG